MILDDNPTGQNQEFMEPVEETYLNRGGVDYIIEYEGQDHDANPVGPNYW